MKINAGLYLVTGGLLSGVLVVGGFYLWRGSDRATGALAGWLISIPPGLLSYYFLKRAGSALGGDAAQAVLWGTLLRMGAFLVGLLLLFFVANTLVSDAVIVGLPLYFGLLAVEVGIVYRRTVRGGECS